MNKIENNYAKVIDFLDNFESQSKIVELGLRVNSNTSISDYLKHNVVIYNIVKFLKEQNPTFFHSTNIFKTISVYLCAFINDGLSEAQIADFMLNLVDKNKDREFKSDLIDLVVIYNQVFCDMHYEDIRKCRKNLDFSPVIKYAKDYKREILNNIADEDLKIDYMMMKENIDVILSRIINNSDVSQDDIDACLNAFANLKVTDEILKCISNILNRRYEKRIKRSLDKEKTPIVIKKEEHKSNLITDKEYKSILKEIRKYFNPYTNTLNVEELSDEERNHVLSLMVKIGIDKYSIMRFMNLTEKDIKEDYDYFKEHIEEYDYYYQEYMDTLMDYYNESLKCNPDEVEFWKDEINRILDNLKYDGKLYSYEYEIKKVMGNYGTNTGKC